MNKLEMLLRLYRMQLKEIMSDKQKYAAFLSFAAPLYKHNFSDIILIHAQRPNASQCADFTTWTERLGLRIRSGAAGIPVVQKTANGNRVAYLYDVSDVTAPVGRKIPMPWETSGASDSIKKEFFRLTSEIPAMIETQCEAAQSLYSGTKVLQKADVQEFMTDCAQYLVTEKCRIGWGDPLLHEIPPLQDMETEILVNQLIFSVAKEQLRSAFELIKNERSDGHDREREVSQQFADDSGRGEPRGSTDLAENRAVRANVDSLHGGTTPQNHIENADGKHLLPDSERERPASDRDETGRHRPNESRASRAKRHDRADAVAEQLHTAGRGTRESGLDTGAPLQLSLFATIEEQTAAFPVEEPQRPRSSAKPDVKGNVPQTENEKVQGEAIMASPFLVPIPESEPPPQAVKLSPRRAAANYRIPEDFSAPIGQKGKYRNNVNAIRLLKELEENGAAATPAQQAVLSGYVGWGGVPQVFDQSNEKWAAEYAALRELLTDEEYRAARASTLNAHYTSPIVIRAIYNALDGFFFDGGKVLEPAMGVGNFFGLIPERMAKSELYGVELDNITGRIAQYLYPDADIRVQGFQEAVYQDGYFDVAVGNVPFGDYNISDDNYNLLIHDYFFAKTLDKLRGGGIAALITSKGTLDKANPTVRRLLAQKADLLGAIRLPNDAFSANAGTEVTTDILFFQKRETPLITEPDWLYLGYYSGESNIKINQYYLEHPEMVLGTMSAHNNMYAGADTTCNPYPNGRLEEQLARAIGTLEGRILPRREPEHPEWQRDLPLDSTVKRFTYTVMDDNIYYNDGKQLAYVEAQGITAGRIKAFVNLRAAVNSVIREHSLYFPILARRARNDSTFMVN